MVEKLILAFIQKSGGLEKINKARDGIRSIPDASRAEYVRRCARTDEGARQLLAAALLGFALAAEVGRQFEECPDPISPADPT